MTRPISASLLLLGLLAGPVAAGVLSGGSSVVTYSTTTANSTLAPAATTVYGNLLSVTLPAGHYELSALVTAIANGATVSTAQAAISVNSGNTLTDHVLGSNICDMFLPTATINASGSVPLYVLDLTQSTVVYLKVMATYIVATPLFRATLIAKRS